MYSSSSTVLGRYVSGVLGISCIAFGLKWSIHSKNIEHYLLCNNGFLWEFKVQHSLKRKWQISIIDLNVTLWMLNLRYRSRNLIQSVRKLTYSILIA